MRIVIVITSLCLGGAQRAATTLAVGLHGRGHEVSVLTFARDGAEPFFPLPKGVPLRQLNLLEGSGNPWQALSANLTRLRTLRRVLLMERPDVVLPFMDTTNILTILALFGTDIPVLACERTNPAAHSIGGIWRLLRRLAYPLAAGVVAQTEAARRLLPGYVLAIPNPVNTPDMGATPVDANRAPEIIALGRLAPEKGFDMLIRAFARVAQRHPRWLLRIVGEGQEAPRLETLCRGLGLERRVLLPGGTSDPTRALQQADVFALSSRYEGFPNALCEALACGLPAVAFDCPSGPAEILRHEVDGLLVPAEDVTAFAQAMQRLMDDQELRRAMAARAPEVLDRFGTEGVLNRWEALLTQAAHGKSPCAE